MGRPHWARLNEQKNLITGTNQMIVMTGSDEAFMHFRNVLIAKLWEAPTFLEAL